MTSADWGALVPSIAALITAAAAWLRAQAAHRKAVKVEKILNGGPPNA